MAGAGGAAGERAAKGIVAVAALGHERVAAMVGHADDQVALRFIALRERHVAGQGERLQQVAARQVTVGKLLFTAAVQEAGGSNAAIVAVAGAYGLQGGAVLAVHIARGAAQGLARFGDEVGIAIPQQ